MSSVTLMLSPSHGTPNWEERATNQKCAHSSVGSQTEPFSVSVPILKKPRLRKSISWEDEGLKRENKRHSIRRDYPVEYYPLLMRRRNIPGIGQFCKHPVVSGFTYGVAAVQACSSDNESCLETCSCSCKSGSFSRPTGGWRSLGKMVAVSITTFAIGCVVGNNQR